MVFSLHELAGSQLLRDEDLADFQSIFGRQVVYPPLVEELLRGHQSLLERDVLLRVPAEHHHEIVDVGSGTSNGGRERRSQQRAWLQARRCELDQSLLSIELSVAIPGFGSD